MNRSDLSQRMIALDDIVAALYPGTTFRCVIVGGGALLSLDIISRATLDVDVLEAPQALARLFESFDFNDRVKALVHCFAERYDERLIRIEPKTRAVMYYTPSIEDLIISKLYAYRAKDVQDIDEIVKSGRYDPDLLDEIVKEAKRSALNERVYAEMVDLYHRHFKQE